MPRFSRQLSLLEGFQFHKCWRGHNREWNLKTPMEKLSYLHFLNEEIIKQTSPLYALTLMNNHAHELYSLHTLKSFSEFMRRHHSRYGLFFNKKHQRCGKVAQERAFTCVIEEEAYPQMKVTFYIHANPIRAKMVNDAKDYEWSTHRLYAYGKRSSWMKCVIFPKWYMELGKTMKERQAKYRKLFDAFLREEGLIKRFYSRYGVGNPIWVLNRRIMILKTMTQVKATSPPGVTCLSD